MYDAAGKQGAGLLMDVSVTSVYDATGKQGSGLSMGVSAWTVQGAGLFVGVSL